MKHTSRLDIPQHKLVRSLVDYELIGRKWKRSDALSRPILIDRGLEPPFGSCLAHFLEFLFLQTSLSLFDFLWTLKNVHKVPPGKCTFSSAGRATDS